MEYNHTDKADSTKVTFTPPKGFVPPEAKDGQFDLVCTFVEEEGGKLCLTKLGETDMPGYGSGEHKESEHKPDYSEVSKPMMAAMGGEGGSPGDGRRLLTRKVNYELSST